MQLSVLGIGKLTFNIKHQTANKTQIYKKYDRMAEKRAVIIRNISKEENLKILKI